MKRNHFSLLLVMGILLCALAPITISNSAVSGVTEPSGTQNVGPSGTVTLEWSADWSSTAGFAGATVTINYPVGSGFVYSGYTASGAISGAFTLDAGASHNPAGGTVQLTSTTIPWEVNTIQVTFTAPATPGTGYQFTGNSLFSADDFPSIDDFPAVTVNVVASYGVTLTPTTSTERVLTGNDAVHTITVQNDGNVADTFTLSYTPEGTETASYSVNPVALGVGASQSVDVTISSLPDGTTTGTLTATSAGDASTDTATLVSEVHAAGVTVTPPTNTEVGSKDEDIAHTFTVTNTGNYADTFDISVTSGPGSVLPTTVGPLAPGGSDTFVLTVPNTGIVHIDTTDVTAASQADGTVSNTATATSDFKDYAVTVTPDPSDKSIVTGSSTTHTLTITNAGGIADTYDIAYAGDLSPTVSDATVTLAPGATQDITVTYTTPATGDYTGTITATSQTQPAVSDTATLTTKVATYGVTLTDPSTVTVLSGAATAVHTITVTNTGSHEDTFDLSYTGDLAPALSDASVILAAGASTDVTVTYNLPPDGVYTGTLTAESTLIPVGTATDTSALTTNVNRYGVTVVCTTTPQTVRLSQNVIHSFTITNTGNVADTYTVTTTQGTLSQTTVTLAAGANTAVTLTITAPAAGLGQTATVTATSNTQPVLATDADTATHHVKTYEVQVKKQGTTKTLSERVVIVGGNGVHTFTVTNNGNDADTFTITLAGDGTLSAPTIALASGASGTFTVTHITTTAGIKSSTVTVTSQGYSGATAKAYAKTFICEAAKHVTDNSVVGAGTYNLDATATVPFKLSLTTTGAQTVDFYQLPSNPRTSVGVPKVNRLIFGTFTVTNVGTITTATGTVYYTETMVNNQGLDESSMTVYYWNEAQWKLATGIVRDPTANSVTFTIGATDWLERSYDYDFVLAADNRFVPVIGPPVAAEPPTQDAYDDLSTDEQAEILDGLDTEDAAALIEGSSTEQAANVIKTLSTSKATSIVTSVTSAKAAQIVEKLDTTTAKAIVEQAVTSAKTTEIAKALVETQKSTVADLLLTVETGTAAKVIKEMGTDDLTSTAERVEEAVKKQINELNSATKQQYKQKIKSIMEDPDLTVDDLVNLFVEIANLPNTPSTVAEIFEIIETSQTVQVVDGMIAKDKLDEIGLVFSYLTDEKLVEIYTALTSTARTAIFPYLDETTLGKLPELATFSVTVTVSPTTVTTGSPVTVTATISNTAAEIGSTDITATVNGVALASETVIIAGGESTTLTWTVTKSTAGTYTVNVNGETATFTVQEPETPLTPAEFETSDLTVSPSSVLAGEDVTVSVKVSNVGEESGSYTVKVKLDGVEVDSEQVTLSGESSSTLTFTVTSETEGSHTVTVDELSASFTVEAPPAGFPWTMAIIGIVIIAAVVGYLYMQQKKKTE